MSATIADVTGSEQRLCQREQDDRHEQRPRSPTRTPPGRPRGRTAVLAMATPKHRVDPLYLRARSDTASATITSALSDISRPQVCLGCTCSDCSVTISGRLAYSCPKTEQRQHRDRRRRPGSAGPEKTRPYPLGSRPLGRRVSARGVDGRRSRGRRAAEGLCGFRRSPKYMPRRPRHLGSALHVPRP